MIIHTYEIFTDEKSDRARRYCGMREDMPREFKPDTLERIGVITMHCLPLGTDTSSLSSSIDCLEIGVLLLTDFFTFVSSVIKLI
jgi:hypothetical protein